MKKYPRRKFLGKVSKGSLFLLTPPFLKNSLGKGSSKSLDNSRVIVVGNQNVISGSTIVQSEVQVMADVGIKALSEINDVGEAWKSLFPGITQNSVISIKVNCVNSYFPGHPEVAHSIISGLTSMQVEGSPFPENNIIIWDRTNAELTNCGYTINTGTTGVRCFGTDSVYYNTQVYMVNGQSQLLSQIIFQSDYIINLSDFKNASISGVTFSMKNHYGSCNQPYRMHDFCADPFIPALNALPPIRNKQVVCIGNAIYGIESGSTSGPPNIVPKRMIFSTDPVAHDYIGSEILRTEYNWAHSGNASHIATAAQAPYNLGTNDPNQIDLITIPDPWNKIDLEEPHHNPDNYKLFQNYPNPFNATTNIEFSIPKTEFVTLKIHSLLGQEVSTLVSEKLKAGQYKFTWDAGSLASGVYLYHLQAGEYVETRKMILSK